MKALAQQQADAGARGTVAVGMSGGVDSTMTAILLQQQGYTVIGVTMQVWDGSVPLAATGRAGCFGPGEVQDLEEIRAITQQLGIRHVTLPLADAYHRAVLDYFRSEYLRGRTPNPCVVCNQAVKFGALLTALQDHGIAFDYFATGHYARVGFDHTRGRYALQRGRDTAKDQSYFLSQLHQEQLRRVLCPLGEYRKADVKRLAERHGFAHLAAKKESQDFIESEQYDVLFAGRDLAPGPIVDLRGTVLGQHRGIVYYTVGQRKGLGIGGAGAPYYVVRIDACNNTIVVGRRADVFSNTLTAGQLNYIALERLERPLRATVKIRQQHTAAPALVTPRDAASAFVTFDQPQMAITPGQAVAIYDGDVVVAGGFIA